MNTRKKIFAALFKAREKKVKLKDGAVVVFQGESPETGSPVFGLSKDREERFPLPKGTYETEDERFFKVDENSTFQGFVSKPENNSQINPQEILDGVGEMIKEFDERLEKRFAELQKKFGFDEESPELEKLLNDNEIKSNRNE